MYRRAEVQDAKLLVDIYNAAFYDDFIKYGQCPAYGRTQENMESSILRFPKYIIYCEDKPVGVISFEQKDQQEYYIGCLCVIPEFQGRGLGTKAFEYFKQICPDWKKITLITPVDKEQNVKFYTEKCGFKLGDTEMDGNVKVVRFFMER